jgi:hypothetical protein
MQRYDPLKAPDPEQWLALDEQERIELARDYHRRKGIRLLNATLHATAHAIVENQIALGDETPARRTAQRLMDEGRDRHEAIHAVGMVLMESNPPDKSQWGKSLAAIILHRDLSTGMTASTCSL